MFTWLGLSNRLNIIVISINILILIVVAFLANASSATALRTQSIERFDTKVQSAFTSVDTRLVAFESFATEVSEWVADFSSLSVATSVQTEVTAFLDNDNAQDVYSISILRPEDTVIWLSPTGENIGDMPQTRLRILAAVDALENTAIQTALASDEPTWFLQETALFDGAEQATITLAIPYNHIDGLGLVWVDMLQSTFTDMMTTALNEEGITIDTLAGYTAVANNAGTVIEAENLPTDALDSSVGMGVLLDRAQNAPEVGDGLVQFEDPFTQQEGLFSINSFNTSNNWLFISVLPESEIPVLPNNVYLPIFLVGVGGILILLLVLRRFLSDAVVTPLVDLGKSATEIGEGNMRFIVFHQDKRDEIGMLANAMESMRERLRESYDELENWSINLEDRVERRTVQLAAARQEAEKTAQQLQVVYDESLSVVNETQLEPVLNAFIDRITMLLESHYCAVWLLNDERTLLRLVATNDERHSLLPKGVVTIDIAQGIVGQTIRLDQPVVVNDYPNYEHRVNLADYFDDSEAPFTRGLCAPLKFDGQVIGAVVVGRHADRPIYDAEAQRQLTLFVNMVAPSVRNAQLMVKLREAVREAERANDVKTRFLASVTHELRTPLNLIINNMDFMRVGAFGDVNDEQIRRLNQTVRSAEHLLYLINDLLD
ncbi:MAG: GAF domain-containing protein, partial [Chloroflexota bacterium]